MPRQNSTETVWTQLGADLRRFIRGQVSDAHIADDLLQETFIRIHRRLNSLKHSDRLAAWVYQIARNVIADQFRRNSSGVSLAEDVAESSKGIRSMDCIAAGWLTKMVEQLPNSYRDAVRLSELEGLSQQEVADRLGLSISGAKSRVQRGRRMLKDAMLQCCHFDFDGRGNIVDYTPRSDRTVCLNCDESKRSCS
jgi:RNA polymerase sigma-70 factor, ECF subfamily